MPGKASGSILTSIQTHLSEQLLSHNRKTAGLNCLCVCVLYVHMLSVLCASVWCELCVCVWMCMNFAWSLLTTTKHPII